ncbi:MAG: hypothetical protein RR923_03865 [Bacilli bacterium]
MEIDKLAELKVRIMFDETLKRYTETPYEPLLKSALSYSERRINNKRNTEKVEERYIDNQIEGAIWYLNRLGTNGYDSTSENGMSVSYSKCPEWLLIPAVGTLK